MNHLIKSFLLVHKQISCHYILQAHCNENITSYNKYYHRTNIGLGSEQVRVLYFTSLTNTNSKKSNMNLLVNNWLGDTFKYLILLGILVKYFLETVDSILISINLNST